MEFCVLGSGSRGNSTFVKHKETKLLFDAGLSLRQIKTRLSSIGEELEDITGIFVSHEHIDHIRALHRLRGVPVYMNEPTYANSGLSLEPQFFVPGRDVVFDGIKVNALQTSHDAAMPCGFVVRNSGSSMGIFTDLGCVTENIRAAVRELDAVVIESNHDMDMLINGPYPYFLKERILSNVGHLSNIDAGLFIRDCAGDQLRTAVLAHLSEKNNTPDMAYNTFESLVMSRVRIKAHVANQDNPTEIIRI